MTTKTAAKYQPGTAIEVQVYDFAAAGQPLVWVAATVEAVELADAERGLIDVHARRVDGTVTVQRVGPRGGNKRIRVTA